MLCGLKIALFAYNEASLNREAGKASQIQKAGILEITGETMELSASNEFKLSFIRDIWEVSQEASTKTYFWAGIAKDISNDRFESEHGDIDGFTVDLLNKRETLTQLYERRGYKVKFLEAFHILRIDKNGEHAGFNRLDIENEVALWRHIGPEGTLYFPSEWLSNTPIDFYDTKAFISGLEFEYCIKTHPELLNPDWKGRQKDKETALWAKSRLIEKGQDPENLFERVWSYNPFFAKRGNKEYWLPKIIRKEEKAT